MKKLSIIKAVELLKNGEAVAFPTETVYGLGADAWNPSAVKKVFALKKRPADNPLIVHIASEQMLPEFVKEAPPEAEKLMAAFWPGPLTLIFKKKPEVLDLVTAGLPSVALRWPSHPLSQELIALAGPLVAPSANSSGRPSPTKPEHVKEDLGDDFPVIEAGETEVGLESTVLDVSEKPFRIYRPGQVGKPAIEEVLDMEVFFASSGGSKTTAKSPGTKYTHYAPEAEVCWLQAGEGLSAGDCLYLLHNSKPGDVCSAEHIICYQTDYRQMAHELYDRFRQADHSKYKRILIEPFDTMPAEKPAIVDALVNRISKAIG